MLFDRNRQRNEIFADLRSMLVQAAEKHGAREPEVKISMGREESTGEFWVYIWAHCPHPELSADASPQHQLISNICRDAHWQAHERLHWPDYGQSVWAHKVKAIYETADTSKILGGIGLSIEPLDVVQPHGW